MEHKVKLVAYMASVPHGDVGAKSHEIIRLLANAWNELEGGKQTNMKAEKVLRAENLHWQPPYLTFDLERHGQTVHGSTRATVYTWKVDVSTFEGAIVASRRRQLYATDKRLNVEPIAAELAELISTGAKDSRLVPLKDGSVRLNMEVIIPETVKQTTYKRRLRLRESLKELLRPLGWENIRGNVFARASHFQSGTTPG